MLWHNQVQLQSRKAVSLSLVLIVWAQKSPLVKTQQHKQHLHAPCEQSVTVSHGFQGDGIGLYQYLPLSKWHLQLCRQKVHTWHLSITVGMIVNPWDWQTVHVILYPSNSNHELIISNHTPNTGWLITFHKATVLAVTMVNEITYSRMHCRVWQMDRQTNKQTDTNRKVIIGPASTLRVLADKKQLCQNPCCTRTESMQEAHEMHPPACQLQGQPPPRPWLCRNRRELTRAKHGCKVRKQAGCTPTDLPGVAWGSVPPPNL